jgi:hypothetical protein
LRKEYFREFWNWFDMGSLLINLAYLISDLVDANPSRNRTLSSVAALFMWMKLLYFLRLFTPTAALIRMIVEILKDMFVFTIIYFIAIIGFANAFYILAFNLTDDHTNSMFEQNFFKAILYSYRTGLGDFVTDAFDGAQDKYIWYVMFIV